MCVYIKFETIIYAYTVRQWILKGNPWGWPQLYYGIQAVKAAAAANNNNNNILFLLAGGGSLCRHGQN